jgi:hypothetical protein
VSEPPGTVVATPTVSTQVPVCVTPGPLEEARKILITRIQQAKSEGIGTANYMLAFNALEDSVKAGQTAEQLRPRIESLARALKDQLDRAKILKTQRPIPAGPSQTPPAPDNAGSAGGLDINKIKEAISKTGAAGGGKDSSGLMEKLKDLKDRFGGQIPENLKDRIPKDILDKIGQ